MRAPLCVAVIACNVAATPLENVTVAGRHAHWVLRSSNLEESVNFYKEVLGLRVLRHEENPGACPITCNGKFNTAWSKTMVGYDTEEKSYAIELTYNYGIHSYERGNALHSIAVHVPLTIQSALGAARRLGFHSIESSGNSAPSVLGPDGYRYELLPAVGFGDEAFDYVRLRVQDPDAAFQWYMQYLGMSEQELPAGLPFGARSVGYGPPGGRQAGAPIILLPSENGEPVHVEQWEGRHAIALPATALRAAYTKIKANMPSLIVHDLRELKEQLGILLIAIVKDLDGLEICLVSSEVFNPAVASAANFIEPDWGQRRQLELEHAAAASDLVAGEASPANYAADAPLWTKK